MIYLQSWQVLLLLINVFTKFSCKLQGGKTTVVCPQSFSLFTSHPLSDRSESPPIRPYMLHILSPCYKGAWLILGVVSTLCLLGTNR